MKKIEKLLGLNFPLVLASESPRREKLLKQLGFSFIVQPANIDESNIIDNEAPEEHVKRLALEKANFVAKKQTENSIVIGSDTIVVLNNKILNKPKDKNEAFSMLSELSGKTHVVFTGISLVESVSGKFLTDYKKTNVTFRILTVDEIKSYISTGSPMDKAGSYGIQDDFGAVFVSHIEGCYYNIVGLPLEQLYTMLKTFLQLI